MQKQSTTEIEKRDNSPTLTRRSVASTLFYMALPMLGGSVAMQAFNLTDTWFVAKLGTLPLAAMSFTFPVVMLVACLVRGLGTGATALVSHALGQGDQAQARRVTTHSMILGTLVVLTVSVLGILTITPMFRTLGATEEALPKIHEYMTIWYLGVAFMVLPMVANDAIRATGDTVRPSLLMVLGALINMALDPIMIYGLAWCPALGIRGAALATLISRAITCFASLWILHRRHNLLLLGIPSLPAMMDSWRRVMRIGIPSAFSNLLMPISAAIITRIIAGHGDAAIAATGAGGRIEMFAFLIPMCLGTSLVPFVGQNFGAQRLDRVRQARRQSMTFAVLFGLLTMTMFLIGAPRLATFFSKDPEVISILTRYLRIVCFGHGMMEVHRYVGFFLNGIHKPMHAMAINIFRIVILLVPLSVLGGRLFGLEGVFFGRMIADVVAGSVGIVWSGAVLHKVAHAGEKTKLDAGEPIPTSEPCRAG